MIAWMNLVVKRQDEVIAKFTEDMTQKDCSKLHNGSLKVMELFPQEFITQVVE